MSKQLYFSVVIFLVFTPMLFTFGTNTNPDFISIDENREYVWKTNFNKKPLVELYEDAWGLDEDEAEALTDWYFDEIDASELTVQWKVEPIFISIQDDQRINHIKTNYVTFQYKLCKYHKINDENSKRTIDKCVNTKIYEYKTELYRDMYLNFLLLGEETSPRLAKCFFLANNINWRELASELNEAVESEDFNIDLITVNFNDDVGLEILFLDEDNENFDQLKLVDKYHDGILYYKRLSYNYDTIYEFELEGYNIFFMENWILITIISTICIISAILYILLKRKWSN